MYYRPNLRGFIVPCQPTDLRCIAKTPGGEDPDAEEGFLGNIVQLKVPTGYEVPVRLRFPTEEVRTEPAMLDLDKDGDLDY